MALLRFTPSFPVVPAVLASCSVAVAVAPLGAATAEAKRSFDLPRGDAATTLRQFAAAAGRSLVFATDKVRGETTNAVRGDFTPREALERMLAGSALAADEDAASGALVVSRKRTAETAPRTGEVGPVSDPQPKPKTMSSQPRTLLAAFAGWLAFGASADAQPAAQAKADEAIVLSPFTVNTEKDTGYAAQNTLSGTRLNSSVADLGGTMSIFTPQFLEDMAFSTTNDVIKFAPGMERNDTQDQVNGQVNLFFGDATRIRGIQVEMISRNQFRSNIPSDSYNTTRFEFSRGPNAILFGNNAIVGGVDRTTEDADYRNAGRWILQTDNYGTARSVLNVNRVLLRNKLAIRAAFLNEEAMGWREPFDFKRQKRQYFAVKFQPIRQLTLKASSESFDWQKAAQAGSVSFDRVTPWLSAGSPGRISNAGATAANPAGIVSYNPNPTLAAVFDVNPSTPLVQNWRNYAVGATQTVAGLSTISLPADFIPAEFSVIGRQRTSIFTGHALNANIQWEPVRNLFVEYAFNKESAFYGYYNTNVGNVLWVDASRTLPDGVSTNPNFGRYFTAGTTVFQPQLRYQQNHRVTASYEFDLTARSRWLGRHMVAGLFDQEVQDFAATTTGQYNTTPLAGFPTAVVNSQNLLQRIFYVDPKKNVIFGNTDPRNNLVDAASGVKTDWIPNAVQTNYRSTNNSAMVVWQGRLWNDRIVPTLGTRRDYINTLRGDQTKMVPLYPGGANWARSLPRIKDPNLSGLEKDTHAYGGVFHVVRKMGWLDRLTLTYNTSNSFAANNFRTAIDGSALRLTAGTGKDFGLRTELFGEKVTLSATRFEAEVLNVYSIAGIGQMATNISALYDAIGDTQKANLGAASGSDTSDYLSKGYEFQVVANLTRQWRTMLGYSHYSTQLSNIYPLTSALIAREKSRWLANPNLPVPLRSPLTAQQVFDEIALLLDTQQAQAGGRTNNERRGKFTFLTNYAFSQGLLRGFAVGGSVVWQSAPAIGYALKPLAGSSPVTYVSDSGKPYFGTPLMDVGASVSYTRKVFRDRIGWKVQLNIRNLLDETDTYKIRMASVPAAPTTPLSQVSQLREPRSFVLTNTFSF